MATNTSNYNLVKPADNETADIGVINANMDKVDEALFPENSLESESTKKALAAAQGKVLDGKITSLNKSKAEIIIGKDIPIKSRKEGAIYWVVTDQQASLSGDIKVSPTMGLKVV